MRPLRYSSAKKPGNELRQFIGHTSAVYTAVFSPDGKHIATASADNTARLWDVQTGQELRRFTGHTAGMENIAFSPDGKTILTGSDEARRGSGMWIMTPP